MEPLSLLDSTRLVTFFAVLPRVGFAFGSRMPPPSSSSFLISSTNSGYAATSQRGQRCLHCP